MNLPRIGGLKFRIGGPSNMPNINLPTGNTIYVSTYEYYFVLKEEDIDEFFQSCVADNLGAYIDDPFSNKMIYGKIEVDDIPEVPDEPDEEDLE
jgi:hypothetical protein